MKLVGRAIDNFRFTLIIIITATLMGIISFLTMPRSEDPQLSFPINYLVAVMPGTSPLDMEQMVADPLEEVINEIDELKEIRTEITDGLVTLRVEFNYGADPNDKYDELVAAVNSIRRVLPPSLQQLEVKKLSPSDVNIIQVALSSKTASYRQLRLYSERLEKRLERVSGVKRADIWAIPDQEVQITPDLEKIKHLGLSIDSLLAALKGEARNISAGHVNVDSKRFSVMTSGRYPSIESIENTLLNTGGGTPVYVRDVAKVRFTDSEPTYLARYNGKRSVFITAMQSERTNIYTVTEQIQQVLQDLRTALPDDIELHLALDQSTSVSKRLNGFFGNLLQGLVCVGVLVLAFLGFRNMAIVLTIVPVSVLIGFALLDISHFGIEQMSIVGLVLALGLLVDNAIVITESIAQKRRQGESSAAAARSGTLQVSSAVTSGTVTTLFAFLPILAMQTNAGSFIRSLPLIVMYVLVASLLICLTLTPVASAWLFGKKGTRRKERQPKATQWLLAFSEGPYKRLLAVAIKHAKVFIFLALAVFFGSLLLFKQVGVSLFEKAENDRLLINIRLPINSSLAQTGVVTGQVEAILAEMPEVTSYASNIGHGNPRVYYSETPTAQIPHRAQIFVQVKVATPREFWQFSRRLQARLSGFKHADVYVKNFQQGAPIEAPVVVQLFGDDFADLQRASLDVESIIAATQGAINIENPAAEQKINLRLVIDRERAGRLQVPIAAIDDAVQMSLKGMDVGLFRDNYGDDFHIVVRLSAAEGARIEDFKKILVADRLGQLVPLEQVARLEFVSVPARIQHQNSQRSFKITAHVLADFNVEQVTEAIAGRLEQLSLPEGINYRIGGERKSRGEAFRGFIKSIVIALLGIFTVLVFQFRSFSQPLIVFLAIPFSVSGAIFALYMTGYNFSFMAFLGIAALIGIVVNNSIILIDAANELMYTGLSRYHACIQASKSRLSPILLTSFTTVVCLIPLALTGSLTWSPLAWVIIGGMLLSTLISLLLVPVMYAMFHKNTVSS